MVTGTITYPSTPTLPADAVLTVKLMHGTRDFPLYEDNISESIVEQRISPVGPGPVPFALAYDPAVIEPEGPYSILVELSAGGTRLATGGRDVITRDQPSDVAVTVWPVPSATAVTGTVRYASGRPVAPGSVLTIELAKSVNGITEDPTSPIVGVQEVRPVDASPVPFTIPFDPSTLDPYATYHLFATLQEPGGVSWRTQFERMLTWGDPTTAELTLKPPAKLALLTGQITLPDSSALSLDAVVLVQMVEFYKGSPSLSRYQHRITQAGASPIPYAIEYSPEPLSPFSLALYASVQLHGKLLYTSSLVPLDRNAMPSTLDLRLERPANPGIVRGTVRYNPDRPLPPDAKLFVQLAHRRSAGEDDRLVITQTIPLTGAQPLSFAIEYDLQELNFSGAIPFAIMADIRTGIQVHTHSSWQPYMITSGNPIEIEIVLH